MQTTGNRHLYALVVITLLLTLILGLTPSGRALAAVNEDFEGYTIGTTAETVGATNPGFAAMDSAPVGSTTVDLNPAYPGTFGTTQALYNLGGGASGTLTIDFDVPQDSYQLDFITDLGPGNFAVFGYRAGFADLVFAFSSPQAAGVEVGVASGSGTVFDRLFISSTTDDWGIDNLVTTDAAAGVTLLETGGSTDVDEAAPGTTDSYSIALDSAPTGNVTVNISTDGQCNVSPTSVTFVTGDFAPQAITVDVVDDLVAEASPHPCTITHDTTSSDTNYQGLSIPLTVDVTDNDTAGVTVNPTTLTLAEGGATDSYTVVLDSEPTAGVTIVLSTPDGECNITSPNPLPFTPGNWDTPQTVTVEAVDDLEAEGAHSCTITHTAGSSDGNYDLIPIPDVTGNITDDDVVGVTVTPTTMALNEGTAPTSGDYDILLTSAPTGDVTITITPDANCNVSQTAPVIGAGTVGPVTITVDVVDDGLIEGVHTCTITHSATSSDTNYDGIAMPDVVVDITDNDVPGVTIGESGGNTSVTEGSVIPDTYTLTLDTVPLADVTVSISDDGQCQPSSLSVTFTAPSVGPISIDVLAADDGLPESLIHPCVIQHTITASGPDYASVTIPDLTVNVTDNDTPGVVVDPTTVNLSESGTTQGYTVVLATAPSGANTVDISVTPDTQCTVNGGTLPITLTFTNGNFNVPQTVTVGAVDDDVDEGTHNCTIVNDIAPTTTDPAYIPLTVDDVTGNITDDDTAGVTVNPTLISITEAGVVANYSVVLDSQPTASVTINISPDAQCTVSTPTLTFTGADWDTAQPVTVTAVDDLVSEGAHNCVISHTATSTDTNYGGIAVASVTANVTDNDTAGVSIGAMSGTLAEGGATGTYQVVLTTQPTANVVIGVTPDSQCNILSAVPLTFTNGNWFTAQTVTVEAVDDALVEGAHTCTITHTATSGDPIYNGIAVPNQTANITDNDTAPVAGVTVNPTTVNVTEGGAGASYTVVLNSAPIADVTISMTPTPGTQCTANPTTLTFTTGNFGTPQTVNVAAVDDTLNEGPHTCIIGHSATSGDPAYNGILINSVTVNITDNDGVVPTATPLPGPRYSSNPAPGSTINLTTTLSNGVNTIITVQNVGTTPLNVGAITLAGSGQFSLVSPASFTLAPSGTDGISIQCAATQVGTFSTTVSVPHTGVGTPTSPVTYTVNCTVTGAGTGAPGYGSTPDVGGTIDTGAVLIGSPVYGTLTVFETGSGTLRVLGAAISGANAAEFRLVNFPPTGITILDGGTAVVLSIECIPQAAGLRTALLTMSTNDPTPSRAVVTYTLVCTGSLTPVMTATPIGFVPSPPPTVYVQPTGQVVEVKGLAVRTGPYLGATLVGVARPGNTYILQAQSDDEGGGITWYLISLADGTTGWVSGKYLEVSGSIGSLPVGGSIFDNIDGSPDVGVRARTRSIIDLRRRPSARAAIIDTIPLGGEVVVIGRTVEERLTFWVQVIYNGHVGWIPALPVTIRGPVELLPVR